MSEGFESPEDEARLAEEEGRANVRTAMALDAERALRYVIDTPEGRKFVWDFLTFCEIFGGTFDPDPHVSAFKEGKRQAGLFVFRQFDHHVFHQMRQEHLDRESRYHVIPTPRS